jgi:hypothetical protein
MRALKSLKMYLYPMTASYPRNTSVVMMKPGGTGKPRDAICFRKYPLFPMRTWLSISFFFW